IFVLHASRGSEDFSSHPADQDSEQDHKETSLEEWCSSVFEDLVQRNREAQMLWNITRKYNFFNAKKLKATCVKELQEKDEFVLFYLVNVTLEESDEFINKYYFSDDDSGYFYISSDLRKAHFIYGNRSQIISDQRDYLTIIKQRAIQALIISANTVLIVLLNVQRFLDISRALKPSVETCKLTPSLRCVVYMTFLWVWSVGMAFIFGLLDPRIASPLEATLYCLFYILGFSIILAIFNSLTARKLQHAAEQGRTKPVALTGTSLGNISSIAGMT
ncbi:hypothetical protein C0J52_22024, partial [Blattella germanica]